MGFGSSWKAGFLLHSLCSRLKAQGSSEMTRVKYGVGSIASAAPRPTTVRVHQRTLFPSFQTQSQALYIVLYW